MSKDKKIDVKTLGRALFNARRDAMMNRRMAADALVDVGLYKSAERSLITRFETGERIPKIKVFVILCGIYGVKPGTILARAGLDRVDVPLSEMLAQRADQLAIESTDDAGENTGCMIYLPDLMRDEATDLARSRGTSLSGLIRKLLRSELRKHVAFVSRRASS